MIIVRRAVLPLRVFLVALFAVLVVLETMSLPGQFAHLAQESPDEAYLRWPATAVTVFWVVCAQVVVICTWKLITLVQADRIFSEGSVRWVDRILAAVGAGWAVLAGVFCWVGFNADDPGLPLLLFLLVLTGAVAGLVLLVLRALLEQATTLRTDAESVI